MIPHGLVSGSQVSIAEVKAKEEREKFQKLEEMAKQLGISKAELAARYGKATRRARGAAPPKYKNPINEAQVWSGRGRKPQWVKDHLDAGKRLEDLAI